MSNKEILRHHYRPEETKKTWELNGMWSLGSNPGTQKVINGKSGEIWIGSKLFLIVMSLS